MLKKILVGAGLVITGVIGGIALVTGSDDVKKFADKVQDRIKGTVKNEEHE